MGRTIAVLLIEFLLPLGSATCVAAQGLTADRFLARVSTRPVGDQAEQGQRLAVSQALTTDSPAEVQKELPSILQYALSGNEVHVRAYAADFLAVIASRPDSTVLLSSASSEEILSLILDANPETQRAAISVTYFAIGKAGANRQRYLSAFEAVIARAETPQDIDVQMVPLLSVFGSRDPSALKSVLDFMRRDDLTVSTRSDLVHLLCVDPGLPKEVNQALAKELDDPDPTVRAAAVDAFAESTTDYHTLAKGRVEEMANDPQESPQVRESAKQALAVSAGLNPNIDMPTDKTKSH
jgi:hypothetical protein